MKANTKMVSNDIQPKFSMDRNLALELVRVTEAAALAASLQMGRGDEKAADQAAVDIFPATDAHRFEDRRHAA